MVSEVVGFDENYSKQYGSMSGGKGKSKKGNGHKADCGCPICKNMMKKGKKGGVLLVGGNLPEAAEKLREAADALEKEDSVTTEEEVTMEETPEEVEMDVEKKSEEMGGGRRRSSKRGKGKKTKKGGKKGGISYYHGGKKSKKSRKSKKRGRKSRRY